VAFNVNEIKDGMNVTNDLNTHTHYLTALKQFVHYLFCVSWKREGQQEAE